MNDLRELYERAWSEKRALDRPRNICPTCGTIQQARYLNNDPENGPARLECRNAHRVCDGCNHGVHRELIATDGSGEYCPPCAERKMQDEDNDRDR